LLFPFHMLCFCSTLSLYLSLFSLHLTNSLAALGSSRPSRSHAESTIASPFFFFLFWGFFLGVCVYVCVFLFCCFFLFLGDGFLNTTFEEELLLLLS
jgi:hypothetical protein